MSSIKDTKNEESLDFSAIFSVLKAQYNLKTQEDLAERLGIQPQAISNAKNKGKFPIKWIFRLAHSNVIPWQKASELMKGEGGPSVVERSPGPEVIHGVESPPVEKIIMRNAADRRRCHALRAMITDIARHQVKHEGLVELMELGLPNITTMIVRQLHRDKGFLG